MKEHWKEIKGNREIYEVSSLGNVRTKDREGARGHSIKSHILTQRDNSNGYLRCDININGKQKLAEHRDIELMVKEIGEKYGIDIQSIEGNSHLGDFSYPKEDEQKLIAILDRYLKD